MTAAKRILRGLARAVTGLVVLTLASAGGVYAWLQTEGGRDWVKRQAEAALSTPGESEVVLEALDGALPQAPRVSGLTVGDAEGVWLRAQGLVLDWRPAGLLRGRLEVALLRAEAVEVLRTPTTLETADDDSGLSLPRLPLELVVEQVAVETLDLAPAILGEAARFRIEGQSRAQPDGALRGRLAVERSDGGSGRLLVDAAYRPADDDLALTLEVAEPQGGLSAYLLGLPGQPAVDIRLAGTGALGDWRGELSAELAGLAQADAELRLRRGAEIAFGVTAEARVAAPSADPPRPLLAGRQHLTLEGAWREPGNLAVTAFSLEGEALRLTGAGTLDLAEDQVRAALSAELPDGKALARWIGAQRFDGGRADVALSGRLSRPEIEAELRVAQLDLHDVSVKGFQGRARFEARNGFLEGAPSGPLSANAEVEDLAIGADPELRAVLGHIFKADFEGQLDLAVPLLEAERLVLGSDAFEIEASGRLRLDDGAGELRTRTHYFTLSRLDDLAGVGLKGSAEIEGPWRIEGFGDRVEGDLRGRLSDAGSDVAVIASLLSG